MEAGADAPILIGPPEPRAAQIAAAAGLSWVAADGPAALLASLEYQAISGGWLVLDDYSMTPADTARLRTVLDCRMMAFDDHHAWDDPCIDAVVAPSAMAETWSYRSCRAFTGPRHMPLRAATRRARPAPEREGCLVALGGAARGNQVKACAIAVAAMSPVHVAASAGVSPDSMAAAFRDIDYAVLLPLLPDLATQLATAAVCICSGGLVKYEALALGCLPIVVGGSAIEIADTALFARRGLAVAADVCDLADVVATHCIPERLAAFRKSAADAGIGADARAVTALFKE